MRTAFYVGVSTERQQQAQTIEQQVALLRAYVADRPDWVIEEQHIFRDDGHTGAKLQRPGRDALRDQAARANFDVVLVTAPDRLARNYVHQLVILEEFERHGISVVFIDRPPSDDPHEQLVLQIRGAVAEYERNAEFGISIICWWCVIAFLHSVRKRMCQSHTKGPSSIYFPGVALSLQPESVA